MRLELQVKQIVMRMQLIQVLVPRCTDLLGVVPQHVRARIRIITVGQMELVPLIRLCLQIRQKLITM